MTPGTHNLHRLQTICHDREIESLLEIQVTATGLIATFRSLNHQHFWNVSQTPSNSSSRPDLIQQLAGEIQPLSRYSSSPTFPRIKRDHRWQHVYTARIGSSGELAAVQILLLSGEDLEDGSIRCVCNGSEYEKSTIFVGVLPHKVRGYGSIRAQ